MHSSIHSHVTRHMQARMSQRGIPGDLVDLVRRYGRDEQDAVVLDRNGLRDLLEKVRALQRTVMKAIDKGGVVVIEAEGTLVTTYNRDSYDRRRTHAR